MRQAGHAVARVFIPAPAHLAPCSRWVPVLTAGTADSRPDPRALCRLQGRHGRSALCHLWHCEEGEGPLGRRSLRSRGRRAAGQGGALAQLLRKWVKEQLAHLNHLQPTCCSLKLAVGFHFMFVCPLWTKVPGHQKLWAALCVVSSVVILGRPAEMVEALCPPTGGQAVSRQLLGGGTRSCPDLAGALFLLHSNVTE